MPSRLLVDVSFSKSMLKTTPKSEKAKLPWLGCTPILLGQTAPSVDIFGKSWFSGPTCVPDNYSVDHFPGSSHLLIWRGKTARISCAAGN